MTFPEILNRLTESIGRDRALILVSELSGRSISTVSGWISKPVPQDALELLIIKLRDLGHLEES